MANRITDEIQWKKVSLDRFSFFIFIFSAASILFLSSLILVSWGKLPPEVPLFYSRPWGEPILAKPLFLWILPTISLGVLLVNFALNNLVRDEQKFLSKVLVVFALLVSILATYTGTKIISLLV